MATALLKHCVYMDSHISAWVSFILPALLWLVFVLWAWQSGLKRRRHKGAWHSQHQGYGLISPDKLMVCKLLSGHSLMMSLSWLWPFINCFTSVLQYMLEKSLNLKGRVFFFFFMCFWLQGIDMNTNGWSVTTFFYYWTFIALRVLPSCALDTF